jgi:hypothetical protein
MVRQRDPHAISTAAEKPAVDFWSLQYSDINYADYLPPKIPRKTIYYESCEREDFNNERAFAYMDTLPQRYGISRALDETLTWGVHWQRKYLSGSFFSEAGNPSPEELRTALIALDSIGPSPTEPEWAEYLTLFTQPYRSYRHIIGHIHAPGRGLREWRDRLNRIAPDKKKSWFERTVWDAASDCDVVIVTSSSLLETDPGLCASAWTEELVGELIGRFGYAILDREVHDRILGVEANEKRRKPRLFALGSVTPGTHCSLFSDTDRIFDRQRRLISGSFGDLAVDDPQLVITATVNDLSLSDKRVISNSLCSMNRKPLFVVHSNRDKINANRDYGADALNLITLWPFNLTG